MLGAALGSLAGTAVSGYFNYKANEKLANTQEDIAKRQEAYNKAIYEEQKAALAPYMGLGSAAVQNLTDLQSGKIDVSQIPGYQFQYEQGLNALNRTNAAKGLTRSGAAMKGAEQFGQSLASTSYNNYLNQLLAQAGIGQSAIQGLAGAGGNALAGYGSALSGYGSAAGSRATGYGGLGTTFGDIGKTFGSLYDDYNAQYKPSNALAL